MTIDRLLVTDVFTGELGPVSSLWLLAHRAPEDSHMTGKTPYLRAGHRFEGPDGQAYELVRDVFAGDAIKAGQFLPLNGAPKPHSGKVMPDWLSQQLKAFA